MLESGALASVTWVREVLDGGLDGKRVTVRGWLQNKRSSGGLQFLLIRDGTGVLQSTLRKEDVPIDVFESFQTAGVESTVELYGQIKRDVRARGGWELKAEQGRVIQRALQEFPIAKKFHGPEFLLDNRHLYVRSDKLQAILRIRARLLSAARAWFEQHGYTEVHVPSLTAAAVEGGATLFEVKYFEERAYLTQSWQLYAEAMIASVGPIYTVAPSFRAEKSRTRRHLTEYWHVEAEAPWKGLDDILLLEEELLSYAVEEVRKESAPELKLFERSGEDLAKVKAPFPRITYDRALELIGDKAGVKWGDDLGYEQEKLLTVHFDRPFFVTHYPKKAKAFYHKPDPKNPEVTLSADLLAPEGYGEITGGGERIAEYDSLLPRIKEEGMDPKSYQWYLDIRKFGGVPHAGFGLGLERTVAWICKLDHIRDAIAFPRLINRIYP